MPRPTSGTTLQRPDLASIAFEYMVEASQRGFIGLSLLPIFSVSEQSADYPVIPIEALIKLKDTARAPRGAYNRSDYEFETGTYACKEHGWEEPVDDSEASLYRRYFDAEVVATMRSVDIILRAQEQRIASMLYNTSNLAYTNIATEWSTASTATPRLNVMAGKASMAAASGLKPNAIGMSEKVFNNLLLTAEITSAFRYTNPIEIGGFEAQKRIMAQYFGVDEILVGNAIKDSAKKGASKSIADIWDDEYVLLAKVARTMDLRDPSLGRTFLWENDSPDNTVVEEYREEERRSNIYRVRQNTDECFVFAGAGYLLGNITA
ncbi:MAG TPA: hypothetical protein VMV77_14210 [Bacteroidales bacterium]|nr:hypothetical protein [Bacteroidales bacterium]